MIEAGPTVRENFRPLFKTGRLATLTKEEFQSFLYFRNNHHWSGLQRKGPEICSDMNRLRAALAVLLDESRPIERRLDDLQPHGVSSVSGMGRAILTAILLVVFPDKYGVWNGTSQAAMQALGFWPSFERGDSFGSRYTKINEVLLRTASKLGIDLWTLDALWWNALGEKPEDVEEDESVAESVSELTGTQRFGLERHLHEFLRDNWERTELGRHWDLYVEDGEMVGYQYITTVGKIDLLAHHKTENAWLVIELKRNQTSDDTVGQALRYMGFVEKHLADQDDRVEGLIVAHDSDERLKYALGMVPTLKLMLYEVDFRLKPAPSTG